MDILRDFKAAVRYNMPPTLVCLCGHVGLGGESLLRRCPKCGTSKIVDIGYTQGRCIVTGVYVPVHKDHSSFHVRKQEIRLYLDKANNKLTAGLWHTLEMKYSLREKKVELQHNGKKVEPVTEAALDTFFRNMGREETLTAISTEVSMRLYRFAFRRFGAISNERVRKMSRALIRLFRHPKLELFAHLGIDLESVYRRQDWRMSEHTAPHKIMEVPKYMVPIIAKLGEFRDPHLEALHKLDEHFDGSRVKQLAELFEEEHGVRALVDVTDHLIELHSEYGYNNLLRLARYLARDVKLQQGIMSPNTAATLLRDYARMCLQSGAVPEKYPKSLKKAHDIALMNYNVMKSTQKKGMFQRAVAREDYASLQYHAGDYIIALPEEPQDLVKEGASLHHCVASYVNDVINHKCKILFLRLKDHPTDPLLTIEVRGNYIRQARGDQQRPPSLSEEAALTKWAKEKGLVIASH